MARIRPPIVTNLQCHVHSGGSGSGAAGSSVLVVEATAPIDYILFDGSERRPILHLLGTHMRMPPATIAVHDGLLETVDIAMEDDRLVLTLSLAHPTAIAVRRAAGLPSLLEVEMSREPLHRIMRGRRIVIDPGHGGTEIGGKGPVDLREKDKVLAIALYLREELENLGSSVHLTRSGDENPPPWERLALAHRLRAEALILLHLAWFPDPAIGGFRAAWATEAGRPLAEEIHRAFTKGLPLRDRGWGMGPPLAAPWLPAAFAECAVISNPVEEGWLRSSTFLKRAARAIANGLKDYFAWLAGS